MNTPLQQTKMESIDWSIRSTDRNNITGKYLNRNGFKAENCIIYHYNLLVEIAI